MNLYCGRIGLSGAQTHIQEIDGGYEARQAVALFGSFQMDECDLEKIDFNPFHKDFYGNHATGTGNTKEKAIASLEEDMDRIHQSLWV